MPTDPLRLDALTRVAIRTATTFYLDGGSLAAWEKAMQTALTRGHTAAALAGLAERLGVPLDGALLSERRLSRAERADIKRALKTQFEYLRGFRDAIEQGGLSEAQIRARADMYAAAVRLTYQDTRWGDWEIPDDIRPGHQQCMVNCLCRGSVKDNGDGTGIYTRSLGGTERHCSECPDLVGDYPVTRRGYAGKAWAVKHGKHDQRTHGRATGRRTASRSAYRAARAGGASIVDARRAARDVSDMYAAQQRIVNIRQQMSGHMSDAQRQSHQAELERLEGRVRGLTSRGMGLPSEAFAPTVQGRQARETETPLVRNVRAIEDRIRPQRYESLYALNNKGDILIDRDGAQYSVDMKPSDRPKLKDATVTHNHPRGWDVKASHPERVGNSFSPEDIDVAIWGNVAEIRAVTPLRRYSMRRPPGGWPKDTMKVYDQENKAVRLDLSRRIAEGTLTPEQASAQHFHAVWLRVTTRLGIPYGYTED